MEVVIFCGSSISINEARKICASAYFPGPIKRDDLDQFDADIYCIIDGFFCQNLAVSPKEIIKKLRKNKYIFGGSSMGALRAAECYSFGMKGYGEIFKAYQSQVLDSDDSVAVTIHPESYCQLSDAFVDIAWYLDYAQKTALITCELKNIIELELKQTHYRDRNFKFCLLQLYKNNMIDQPLMKTLGLDYELYPKRKYLDALECLAAVNSLLSKEKGSCNGKTFNKL